MNLTLIKYAVIFAACFGSGFGTAWKWQASNIYQINLERKDERISIERAARSTLERHQATVAKAQDNAEVRVRVLTNAVIANSTELDRLRNADDAAMRAASSTLEACVAHATAQSTVLGQCASRLVEMAGNADGHASDVKTLIDSWTE